MEKQFEKFKGIHPGIILDRELKKRSIKQRPFALSIAEHPQSFNAIIKGKRSLSTALALKIEKGLGLDEGTLVLLQAYHDIKTEKEKLHRQTPDLTVLRKSLFWDTDISQIDWQKQAKAVIKRVFERGDEAEKKEISRFYGQEKVKSVLQTSEIQQSDS
ncbi:Plasmid maintenance system antidote protein VapI, contains XRE-type HTH domain [Dyadobacter sp. SG02]|uniref:helix-turn-helix transcriptional regulator n=1 Tax=Dyadobacter sp. SG02 TaxID=1855291 RepID=UPI0008AE8716|nr:plasmid maintenance system antidote protein [Dyadobacter sp. SG02]SEJ37133.1 Plasmid maintenance system antidote protein VapI, contains XRE-type HTH domain [Dyadobacter sp. SG02]